MRELTDEEITRALKSITRLILEVTEVLETMTKNMDHLLGILRQLADLREQEGTLPDRDKEATP